MKKLLLAPFLLASLFSLCGELKANPRYSNSGPIPAASAQRWYMVTIATKQQKTATGFSQCPLRNYWYYVYSEEKGKYIKKRSTVPAPICDHTHNHIFTFSKWIDTDQAPVQPSNIAFKSLAECNAQARAIKNFYDSHPYDGVILSHTHNLGEKGGWDKNPNLYYVNAAHHEHSAQLSSSSRFYFNHKCIKGTVDY